MNTARAFVRSLTAGERQALETGRKSADPLTVRRSLVLLASADGLACLTARSHARKDPGRVWDQDLKELPHRRGQSWVLWSTMTCRGRP